MATDDTGHDWRPVDPPGDLETVDRLSGDAAPLLIDRSLTRAQVLDRLCTWLGVPRDDRGNSHLTATTLGRVTAALIDADPSALVVQARRDNIERIDRQTEIDLQTYDTKTCLSKSDAIRLLITVAQDGQPADFRLPSDSVAAHTTSADDAIEDYR